MTPLTRDDVQALAAAAWHRHHTQARHRAHQAALALTATALAALAAAYLIGTPAAAAVLGLTAAASLLGTLDVLGTARYHRRALTRHQARP